VLWGWRRICSRWALPACLVETCLQIPEPSHGTCGGELQSTPAHHPCSEPAAHQHLSVRLGSGQGKRDLPPELPRVVPACPCLSLFCRSAAAQGLRCNSRDKYIESSRIFVPEENHHRVHHNHISVRKTSGICGLAESCPLPGTQPDSMSPVSPLLHRGEGKHPWAVRLLHAHFFPL